jgi:DNA-binding XRE family transcriptional regulator
MSDVGEKFTALEKREKSICQRFKLAREDAGITQEKIGLHIGLSRDQVASVESERVALRFRHGWKFCIEIDINAAWLAYGQEPLRPCVDYFKEWLAPEAIESDPDILFSAGFELIAEKYIALFDQQGLLKRKGGGLRKELHRPVHSGGAPHKQALSILLDAWFSDLGPSNRDELVAHLCRAAQDFKKSIRKKR